MTRQPQASRPGPAPQPSNRASRGEGGGGRQPIIAPLLGLVALIVIAAGSLWTISLLGLTDSTAATPTDPPNVVITANPSAGVEASVVEVTPSPTPHSTIIVTPPPDKTGEVVGTILVSKQGDIYSVTGKGDIKRVQGTKTGDSRYNSAPVWMPDGKRFLFVQTITKQVDAPYQGKLTKYTFFYPNIMSVNADGGDPKMVFESIFPSGGGRWFSWVLQPDVSPDGKTIAVVTDGKDGYGDVQLGTMTINGTQLKQLDVPAVDGQGHNDPAWSPDGKTLAFTYNYRRQGIGVPKIGLYNVKSGQTTLLKGGYANPSWSPDGNVIVAERTDGNGRDIVIIDPRNGSEIARLTNDGDSFSPTFSPNGDQIAFLRRKGLTVNLWLLTLDPANGYTRVDVKPLTDDPDGLDAESPPSWFISEADRKPLVTPRPDVLPSIEADASAGPGASTAP